MHQDRQLSQMPSSLTSHTLRKEWACETRHSEVVHSEHSFSGKMLLLLLTTEPLTCGRGGKASFVVTRLYRHRRRNRGERGAVGVVALTKCKAWGHSPTIAHSHDSDTASPSFIRYRILTNWHRCSYIAWPLSRPTSLESHSMSQRSRRTSVESHYIVAPPPAQ